MKRILICVVLGGLSSTANAYTLTLEPTIHVGSWPASTAIADIDGDGRADVVLSTSYYFDAANDYHDFVFFQTAAGGLSAPRSFAYGGPSTNAPMIAADLNGDGKAEIINGRSGGISISSYAGGVFSTRQITGPLAPEVLLVVDVDRDGFKDIVAQSWGSGATIYYGDAALGFSRQAFLSTPLAGYDDVKVGDLNNDGYPDLVMSSRQASPNTWVMYHNKVNGFLPAQPVPALSWISGVAAGDFNGDGLDDFVAGRPANSPTSLFLVTQAPSGALNTPVALPTYDIPETLVAGDFDVDGQTDVAVLHGGWNTLGVYLQGAQGLGPEMRFAATYASHYGPHALSFGDITGDGCPDFVAASYNYGLEIHHGSGCVTTDLEAATPSMTYSRVTARVRNTGAASAMGSSVTISFARSHSDTGFALTTVPDACVLLEQSPQPPPDGEPATVATLEVPPADEYTFGCTIGALAHGSAQDFAFDLKSKLPTRVDVHAFTATRELNVGNNVVSGFTSR